MKESPSTSTGKFEVMGIQEEKCLKSWESKRKLADAMYLLPSDKKKKMNCGLLVRRFGKKHQYFEIPLQTQCCEKTLHIYLCTSDKCQISGGGLHLLFKFSLCFFFIIP